MRTLPLFLLSLYAATAFAQERCWPNLSYWGYGGPEKWRDMPTKDPNECGGDRQSPINLPISAGTVGRDIVVNYAPPGATTNATIQNTGHDFEVKPTSTNNTIEIDGKPYTLTKFHFHVPGEHQIDGDVMPAEMHLVHERIEGGKPYLAVIGVRLKIGGAYPALEPVFSSFPVCLESRPLRLDFPALFEQNKLSGYYKYPGSLTTPPCTENVTWYVLHAPRDIRDADWIKLKALGENARPPQKPRPQDVEYIRPNKQ